MIKKPNGQNVFYHVFGQTMYCEEGRFVGNVGCSALTIGEIIAQLVEP